VDGGRAAGPTSGADCAERPGILPGVISSPDDEVQRPTRPAGLLPDGRPFTALVLDMDGLMVDTEAVEFRAWQRAAQDFGWSVSAEQYQQLVGRTHRDGWHILTGWWQERPGRHGTLAEVRDRADRYMQEEPVVVKPGLAGLLDWARDARLPVGVASSSARSTVQARLAAAGVLASVDRITGGDEVAAGKPAPDIFLLAARRLGREPGACVAVEDSDSGIRAAAAAGMVPFLVPDSSIPRVVPPDIRALAYRTCASLSEVRDILSGAPATAS
jgi:HAD superfamily hydrolase (TIGR01509 family)